ncbi:MAG: 4Fe-4S binding protein [Candidatus Firestonebacteria bacterium]|nr:4Fe-4S binding protein [Candidatus Firestonebacteria bacterium]
MNIRNRNQHMFFFTSMLLLMITGFFQKIPENWMPLLGKDAAWWFWLKGVVHRIAAVVFVTSSIYHFGYMLFTKVGRESFKGLLPGEKDFISFWELLKYSFGFSNKRPKYGRFNFNEKLEYWTVFRASLFICLTGTILWIEELWSPFILDSSRIIHKHEAIIAVMATIIWQFFNLHPEFYFYRKKTDLPCDRDECPQCGNCINLIDTKMEIAGADIVKIYDKDAVVEPIIPLKDPNVRIKKTAYILCKGQKPEKIKELRANGINNCKDALAHLDAAICPYSCVGCGTCVSICPIGAARYDERGVPYISQEECIGCGKCKRECPRNVITIVPNTKKVHILCSSKAKTQDQRTKCTVGCIGCGICIKNCPYTALIKDEWLAVTDYEKCRSCGICSFKCPQKVIIDCVVERGRSKVEEARCVGCDICSQICPTKAIAGDVEITHNVDMEKCIGCELCVKRCPMDAIDMVVPVDFKKKGDNVL